MGVFSLNAVGAVVWEALDQPRSVEELVERVVTEFEVEPTVALGDVHSFLEQLESKQLVRRVEP
jgi:hypothetical protein